MLTQLRSFLYNLPSRPSLGKEIAIILTLKFVGMYFLWVICFSHPIDKHLTGKDIVQHVINTDSKS